MSDPDASYEFGPEVTKAVRTVDKLNWEIGPGRTNDTYRFAFAPYTRAQLQQAREIVATANVPSHWEIVPYRPRKKHIPGISVSNKGNVFQLSIEGWSYALTAFNDFRLFDVTVEPGDWTQPEEVIKRAATIAVQALVGDLVFIQLIDRVEIASGLPEEQASRIFDLHPHLAQIVNPELASYFDLEDADTGLQH